jgi:hypothetical protein
VRDFNRMEKKRQLSQQVFSANTPEAPTRPKSTQKRYAGGPKRDIVGPKVTQPLTRQPLTRKQPKRPQTAATGPRASTSEHSGFVNVFPADLVSSSKDKGKQKETEKHPPPEHPGFVNVFSTDLGPSSKDKGKQKETHPEIPPRPLARN